VSRGKRPLFADEVFFGESCVDGLNRYAYCWNNPMNYVDPTGHGFEYNPGNGGGWGPIYIYKPEPEENDGGSDSGSNSGSGGGSGSGSTNGNPQDHVDKNGDLIRWVPIDSDNRLQYGQQATMGWVNYGNSDDYLASNPGYSLPGGIDNIDDTEIAEVQTEEKNNGGGGQGGGNNEQVTYAPEREEKPNKKDFDIGPPPQSYCNWLTYNKLIDLNRKPGADILNGMTAYNTYKKNGVTTTTEPLPGTMGLAWMWMVDKDLANPGHLVVYVRNPNSNKYTLWYSRGRSEFEEETLDVGQIDFNAGYPGTEGVKKIEFMPFKP
jgi:hypothetical protein